MEYYLANGWAAFAFALLAVIAFIGLLIAIFGEKTGDRLGSYIVAVVLLCVLVLLVSGFWWSSHHFAGKPNTSYLLIEQTSGTTHSVSGAGIYPKEWTERRYTFPGASAQQWCPVLTPTRSG